MRFKRKPAKHFCLLSFFKYLIRIVFATTYIIYVKRFSRSFVFDWTPVKYFPTHFSWLNLRYIQERKKKDLGMQCKRWVSWSNILKRVRYGNEESYCWHISKQCRRVRLDLSLIYLEVSKPDKTNPSKVTSTFQTKPLFAPAISAIDHWFGQ